MSPNLKPTKFKYQNLLLFIDYHIYDVLSIFFLHLYGGTFHKLDVCKELCLRGIYIYVKFDRNITEGQYPEWP